MFNITHSFKAFSDVPVFVYSIVTYTYRVFRAHLTFALVTAVENKSETISAATEKVSASTSAESDTISATSAA